MTMVSKLKVLHVTNQVPKLYNNFGKNNNSTKHDNVHEVVFCCCFCDNVHEVVFCLPEIVTLQYVFGKMLYLI